MKIELFILLAKTLFNHSRRVDECMKYSLTYCTGKAAAQLL